jgi:hypothetical protein
MTLAEKLVQIASEEIGTTEVGNTNCGPRVNQYKAATTLPADEPWPWCAAFVCWVIRESMRVMGEFETKTFKRPRTASAFNFINWSLAQDATTSTMTKNLSAKSIATGDIIVFKFSHIGIATSGCDENGEFSSIEGNTDKAGSREGGGVFAKKRNLSSVKARIRFTV